jgi:hypothetical protein
MEGKIKHECPVGDILRSNMAVFERAFWPMPDR